MNTSAATYDLTELADKSGLTPRTIRYYIQRDLLPSPGSVGPGTRYGQGFLNRLRLIRQLQDSHLTLDVIAGRLKGMSDDEVRLLLREQRRDLADGSAQDYLSSVLDSPDGLGASSSGQIKANSAARKGTPHDRVTWERFTLADGVEIHIKRPVTRSSQHRIQRVIDYASQVFGSS